MKKLKPIVLGMLVMVTTLSFISGNNFISTGFGFQEEKMVSVKEFKEFINKDLITPIRTCFTEAYPHAFMSKCYSTIEFEFGDSQSALTDESLLYSSYSISGNVFFINCGQRQHVCGIKAIHATREIQIQESFLSEWTTKDAYLKSFCERVKATDHNQE